MRRGIGEKNSKESEIAHRLPLVIPPKVELKGQAFRPQPMGLWLQGHPRQRPRWLIPTVGPGRTRPFIA
jgi:hypothetical protein